VKRYYIKLTLLFLILGCVFAYINNSKPANPLRLLETEELNLNSQGNFQFVSRIAKEKLIIGLGESSHGTREFFLFRDKITRQFIENEGFYLVGLEIPYTDAIPINSYINGDIRETSETILKNLEYPFFQNIEFKNFIEWARNYNFNRHDSRIEIFGIDTPVDSQPLKELLLLLKDKKCFKEVEKELHFDIDAPIYYSRPNNFNQMNLILRDSSLVLSLVKVRNIINNCINDEKESKLALFYIQLIEQLINRINNQSNTISFWNARDSAMAENVKWVINSEGNSKAIIWAHNEHIKISRSGRQKYMGYYCRKMFGESFYSIGMDFGQGTFLNNSSAGLQIAQVDMLKNELYARIDGLTEDTFFIFLDSTRLNNALPYIRLHSIKASFNFSTNIKNVDLFQNYNGFLYTKNSTCPKLIVPNSSD